MHKSFNTMDLFELVWVARSVGIDIPDGSTKEYVIAILVETFQRMITATLLEISDAQTVKFIPR